MCAVCHRAAAAGAHRPDGPHALPGRAALLRTPPHPHPRPRPAHTHTPYAHLHLSRARPRCRFRRAQHALAVLGRLAADGAACARVGLLGSPCSSHNVGARLHRPLMARAASTTLEACGRRTATAVDAALCAPWPSSVWPLPSEARARMWERAGCCSRPHRRRHAAATATATATATALLELSRAGARRVAIDPRRGERIQRRRAAAPSQAQVEAGAEAGNARRRRGRGRAATPTLRASRASRRRQCRGARRRRRRCRGVRARH